jgi:type II secretory pathway component PulK
VRPGSAGARRWAAAERGAALVVVLWALVALSGLSLAASIGAVVDLRLAVRHREHAAALAAAETGLAQALAALRLDPDRAARPDSLHDSGEGAWVARWFPAGTRVRLRSSGGVGNAARELEAWAEPSGATWIVVAWREIR